MTNPILRNVKTGVLLERCHFKMIMLNKMFHDLSQSPEYLGMWRTKSSSAVPLPVKIPKDHEKSQGSSATTRSNSYRKWTRTMPLGASLFWTPKPECGKIVVRLNIGGNFKFLWKNMVWIFIRSLFCTENHPSGNDRILSFRGAMTWIWWFSTCPQVGYVIVPFTEVVVIFSKASEFYGVF